MSLGECNQQEGDLGTFGGEWLDTFGGGFDVSAPYCDAAARQGSNKLRELQSWSVQMDIRLSGTEGTAFSSAPYSDGERHKIYENRKIESIEFRLWDGADCGDCQVQSTVDGLLQMLESPLFAQEWV